MKRILSFTAALSLCAGILAAAEYSYKNNTYQKLAEEYSVKAQRALDAGEYALSEEYAQKALENAALSDEFLKRMRRQEQMDALIAAAKKNLAEAGAIRADENYPISYGAAEDLYSKLQEAYESENFEKAEELSRQLNELIAQMQEIHTLPKYYVVQPWEATHDCLWNIAKRPYVYNNPWLWENLYEANKDKFPRKNDPNLIVPGMTLEIPSITGEFRSGTYSPDREYDTYEPPKKK